MMLNGLSRGARLAAHSDFWKRSLREASSFPRKRSWPCVSAKKGIKTLVKKNKKLERELAEARVLEAQAVKSLQYDKRKVEEPAKTEENSSLHLLAIIAFAGAGWALMCTMGTTIIPILVGRSPEIERIQNEWQEYLASESTETEESVEGLGFQS